MTLNPLYKKLMLLFMVFGPFIWLVFSEDGRRRSDIVLLMVFKGGETLNLAFSKLQSSATETDLRGSFPDVEFVCVDQVSEFGNRRCSAPIASFNGAPASSVSAFFAHGRLNVVKLVYQPAHKAYVQGILRRELGEPSTAGAANERVYRWRTTDGLVIMPALEPQTLDDATIMWLATTRLAE
jgi:hypothetical protein